MTSAKKDEDPKGNGVEIVGEAYQELKKELKGYAEDERPVLLIGESGTGKELLARYYAMHTERYSAEKYIAVNCAGVSGGMLASELFGHVKGSFTDAKRDRNGIFREHEGGIVFLDEIGDADDNLQASLLRVIANKDLRPVGSDKWVQNVDVLVVAATNRPKNIRNDLKSRFRLVYVPPLQKFDIPALVNKFMGGYPPKDVMDNLASREYPCNIRDLEEACKDLKEKYPKPLGRMPRGHRGTAKFDYQRYKKEINIWYRFVLPLFEELGAPPVRYQYTQDTKDIPSDQLLRDTRTKDEMAAEHTRPGRYGVAPTQVTQEAQEAQREAQEALTDQRALKKAIKKEADMYARFAFYGETPVPGSTGSNNAPIKAALTKIINQGYLPYLLRTIDDRYKHYGNEGKPDRTVEKTDNNIPDDTKNEIVKALDITNPEEAIKRMRHIYYQHHLTQHNGSPDETATALGINRGTIYNNLK